MPKDRALTRARAWAIIYMAFAGFLVLALLAVDYIIGVENTYPGYDLEMFLYGPHMPYYLTWAEILFNWDAVVAEMPYDIMSALFMAGFAVAFSRSSHEAAPSKVVNTPVATTATPTPPTSREPNIAARVRAVRAPGFVPLAITLALAVIAIVGSAGAYGYQVPGLASTAVFFTGLDDYAFTSHLLPMVMMFSGFFAMGFLPLINVARAPARVKKEGLLLVLAAVLVLSAFYAASPVHYENMLPPLAIIYLVKGWIVSLVVTAYAIWLHAKHVQEGNAREGITGQVGEKSGNSRRKARQSIALVVDARVGLLTSIPAMAILVLVLLVVITRDLVFSDNPALIFQHAFNMVITCTLAIGLIHVADRLIAGPPGAQNAAILSAVPKTVVPEIQEG